MYNTVTQQQTDSTAAPPDARRGIIVEHYPTMSSREISRMFAIPKSTVIRWAKKLNLTHTPETQRRLRDKCCCSLQLGRTPESYTKAARTMKRHRTMEMFRMRSGIPTETNLHLTLLPPKAQKAVARLIREYSYFRDIQAGGHYTLFYDASTRRTQLEHLYTERYRVVFRDAT